jgi:glycosyltransferase involved in cell wall biosynthesis
MKILQIIDSLWVGGAQKLLTIFGDEMLQRGHHVEVITLLERKMNSPIYGELESLGIPVSLFPIRNLADLGTLIDLTRQIKSSKPDIVHTQLNYANIFGTLAARISDIPSVASLHNASVHLFIQRRYRTWMESLVLGRFSRRVIACGYTVAKAQQPRFKVKTLTIIPNPVPALKNVNSTEVKDFRKSQLPGSKGILLVSVGRLTPEKGYPDMFQALKMVSMQTKKDFKLLIVGGGSLLEQLQNTVKDLQMENTVCFLGQRDDVSKILKASDIFLSTSLFEGQSIAVLEAMAAGLAIIVTDVGDNTRVISKDNGIVVPAGHPEMIAKEILKLINDEQERNRLAKNAASVTKAYSPSLWVEKLLALYNEVLHE